MIPYLYQDLVKALGSLFQIVVEDGILDKCSIEQQHANKENKDTLWKEMHLGFSTESTINTLEK